MIPGQGQGAGRIPADVEDDQIPVLCEGRADRGGHVGLGDAGADKSGRDEVDVALFQELHMIRHAEVVVDAVEVDDLNPLSLRRGQKSHVQGDLRLSGAVVSDENNDFFHICLLTRPSDGSILFPAGQFITFRQSGQDEGLIL